MSFFLKNFYYLESMSKLIIFLSFLGLLPFIFGTIFSNFGFLFLGVLEVGISQILTDFSDFRTCCAFLANFCRSTKCLCNCSMAGERNLHEACCYKLKEGRLTYLCPSYLFRSKYFIQLEEGFKLPKKWQLDEIKKLKELRNCISDLLQPTQAD